MAADKELEELVTAHRQQSDDMRALEQDILNVYFRFRNRLFPDGYNVSTCSCMSHHFV